jgi:hypothetical protein
MTFDHTAFAAAATAATAAAAAAVLRIVLVEVSLASDWVDVGNSFALIDC